MSDRQRLRELEAAATPGPWAAGPNDLIGGWCVLPPGLERVSAIGPDGPPEVADVTAERDARFVAALRNAAPDLLDMADEKDMLAASLTDLLRAIAEANRRGDVHWIITTAAGLATERLNAAASDV